MAGKTEVVVGIINNRFVHIPIERAVEYRKQVDVSSAYFLALLDSTGMPRIMNSAK